MSPELLTQDVQLLILQALVKDTKEPQDLEWLKQSPDILKAARETNEKLFEDTHGGVKFDRNDPKHREWFNLNAQLWYASIVYKLMKLKMNIGNKGSKDPTINDASPNCNLCQTTLKVMSHTINQQCVSFSTLSHYDLIALWLETSAVPDALDQLFNSEVFIKDMGVGVIKDQMGHQVISNDYRGMVNPLWNVKTGKTSLQVPQDLSNLIISFLKPKIGNHTEHEKEEDDVWLKFLFRGDQQICNAWNKLDQSPDANGHKCLSCRKLTSFMKSNGKTSPNGPYLATVDVTREMNSISELSVSMVKEMNDLLRKRDAFKESGRFMFPLVLSNATILSTLSNLKSTSHIESSLPPDLNPISSPSPSSLPSPTIVTSPDPNPICPDPSPSSLPKVSNKNMKKEAKLPSFPFIHTIPKALRDLRKRRTPFKTLPSTMKRLSNQSPNANKERNSAVICSHCGYGFKTYEECQEHRKYCDYPSDIRSLLNICQFCYNGFSTTQSLWRHETKDCKLNPDISDATSKKKRAGRPKKSKTKTQSESSSDNMNESSDEKLLELEEEDEYDETLEISEEEFEQEEESEDEDEEEVEDEDEDEDEDEVEDEDEDEDEEETETESEVAILDLTHDSD